MLVEDAVAGEHAEDALEVQGVAAAGREDGGEYLGGGERRVGSTLPNGIGDVQSNDGTQGHGYANHVYVPLAHWTLDQEKLIKYVFYELDKSNSGMMELMGEL
nr:hypothetical protein CICLE_v10033608mg [Ipomoea batatas]GMC56543.1 hypothetical protein CICLE_v10033608mg [Ipomoea batatas]